MLFCLIYPPPLLSEIEEREKQVSFLKNLDLINVLSELSEIDIEVNTCKEIEDNVVKDNELLTLQSWIEKRRRTEVDMKQLDTFQQIIPLHHWNQDHVCQRSLLEIYYQIIKMRRCTNIDIRGQ